MWVRVCLALIALATPAFADGTPAVRYGALSPTDCEAELTSRGIAFERETAKGVLAPVRITTALHGVTYRTNQNAEQVALYDVLTMVAREWPA